MGRKSSETNQSDGTNKRRQDSGSTIYPKLKDKPTPTSRFSTLDIEEDVGRMDIDDERSSKRTRDSAGSKTTTTKAPRVTEERRSPPSEYRTSGNQEESSNKNRVNRVSLASIRRSLSGGKGEGSLSVFKDSE